MSDKTAAPAKVEAKAIDTRKKMFKVRLYSRAIIMGYKRSQRNQKPNTSLVKIQGVNCAHDTDFYIGKKIAYVYTVGKRIRGQKPHKRVIWGKVTRRHGMNGVVRAKFQVNLPPKSFGQRARVMLYPSKI
eukprot:TRINITY_DN4162_c0_g1_i3.p2 TRINITY_DN4162_c0_g1~~TRINITY_DN4162_c0_g1_i3.p2  ORF type:complete len:130 (+),score=11.69 TRINITY_DN4162_c0_g1_i3:20-409(+)